MSREIIININEANKAQKYNDPKELFQLEAFQDVTKILKEHSFTDKCKDIVNCRFHDTIFIDGDRGVGKTAFMVNIEKYYNDNKEDTDKKYIFLNPIDPTLLEHTEKFLSIVLAKIAEVVGNRLEKENIDTRIEEQYFKSLENLSKSLSAIKTLPKDEGIEEIASYKSSLKLEQNSHNFFKIVSNIFEVNALVILIDDVDMAFDKGFDVLEVVRKYLASPYLIPIVAGDKKLYREIVETRFREQTMFFKDIEYIKNINGMQPIKHKRDHEEKKELIDNLVDQYLSKLFPSEYHIELKDIISIIKQNEVNVKFFENNKELVVPFTEIKDFEIAHINLGINQKDLTFQVFDNNTRKIVQYLHSKKSIYIDFFRNTLYDFSKINRYQEYRPQEVIEKYDDDILKFILSSNYKKSLEITYKIYEHSDKKELSSFVKFMIDSYHENNFNLYEILNNNEFKKSEFKIENINDKYVVQYKNLGEVEKINSTYNDIENYIINLFIFNDYFTQHQTKNYIFSGKFIEMLIFSLSLNNSINIEDNMMKEVQGKIKNYDLDFILKDEDYEIYSILFDKNSNDIQNEDSKELSEYFNNLEYNNDFFELSKIVHNIPFNSVAYHENRIIKNEAINNEYEEEDEVVIESKTKELSRLLLIWKDIFYQNTKINSLSLYRIMDKFFENLSKLKPLDVQDTPLEFMQRIVLIFINSIAYFENVNINVANTYIANGTTSFDMKNILTKTNASTLNIKPMVKSKSTLTKALFFHPIISHILFPNEDSKLEQLKFINQNEKNVVKKAMKKKQDTLYSLIQKATNADYKAKRYYEMFRKTYNLLVSTKYDEEEKEITIQQIKKPNARWVKAYEYLTEEEYKSELFKSFTKIVTNDKK